MAQNTSIEWATRTWGPTKGCTLESAGCENCYAQDMAHRFDHPGNWAHGLTKTIERDGPRGKRIRLARWSGVVEPQLHKLDEPLRWRGGPHLCFVNSMSDLFHPKLPWEYVLAVLGVISACPGHTFQVLTKRPLYAANMLLDNAACGALDAARNLRYHAGHYLIEAKSKALHKFMRNSDVLMEGPDCNYQPRWPVPNLWLGTSVENVATRGRIDCLRTAPAALRFVSFEPLLEHLGPELDLSGIDWVIIGGESGPRARPCAPQWIESIVEQALDQNVAVFVKQMGRVWARKHNSRTSKGEAMSEWREDLQIRQFPEVAP